MHQLMMLSLPRLAFSDSLPSLCHVVFVDRQGCLSFHVESDFESVCDDLENNLFDQMK